MTVSTIPPAAKPLSLIESYRLAGATVPKNSRYFDGTPNQDYLERYTHPSGEMMVAAVFDGCGSQPYSHIGAHIGGGLLLRMVYEAVTEKVMLQKRPLGSLDFKSLQQAWGEQVTMLCEQTGGEDWAIYMESRFEFTVVGVVMTTDETLVFHAGDGYFVINGKQTLLTATENAPGYPIYPFLPGIAPAVQKMCWIKTEPVIKTSDVKSIILATDGAEFMPNDLATMSGYQTTPDLQHYLTQLQMPRLVSDFTNPAAVSRLGKPQSFVGDNRADVKISMSVDMTAGFSASIKRGVFGDDVAVIVITKDGSVRRQQVDLSAVPDVPADSSLLGGTLEKIGSIFGVKKRRP